MEEKVLTIEQLDELNRLGIVHKDSNDCYYPIIDKDRWGGACMPRNMVRDLAGNTYDMVRSDVRPGYYDNDTEWVICDWMLLKNFDTLKRCGKFIPEPWSDGKYRLNIMSKAHLEDLCDKDILSKQTYGDKSYAYESHIDGMGGNTFPDIMVDQIAGKTMHCYKPGPSATWVEEETEHRWSISEWMLEDNYEYLKSRALGEWELPGADEDDEEEEEDDEEEEEEIPDWCEASVVGTIDDTNPDYITIDCAELSVPVLCYGDAEGYTVDSRVKVRGNLRRVHNMMGYPEIDIKYIEEY